MHPGAEPEGAPEQGSKPRAQRGLVLGGAGAGGVAVRKGGLPFLSPANPAFSFFPAPHPPDPLPLRGRGRPKVYFAGGFAPGAPALDRLRRLQYQSSRYFGEGLVPGGAGGGGCWRYARGACLLGRLLSLPLVLFPAPIPPDPLPGGKGENQGYFMQGAPPLASPGLNRKRHGLNLRCRCHGGGRIRAALAVSAASGSFFQKRARAVTPSIINSRKVLGGLGDSFKSPPAFLPLPVTASMGCQAGGRRG